MVRSVFLDLSQEVSDDEVHIRGPVELVDLGLEALGDVKGPQAGVRVLGDTLAAAVDKVN